MSQSGIATVVGAPDTGPCATLEQKVTAAKYLAAQGTKMSFSMASSWRAILSKPICGSAFDTNSNIKPRNVKFPTLPKPPGAPAPARQMLTATLPSSGLRTPGQEELDPSSLPPLPDSGSSGAIPDQEKLNTLASGQEPKEEPLAGRQLGPPSNLRRIGQRNYPNENSPLAGQRKLY